MYSIQFHNAVAANERRSAATSTHPVSVNATYDIPFQSTTNPTQAGVRFQSGGTLQKKENAGYSTLGTWLVSTVGTSVEIICSLISGTTPTTNAGLGTWLRLNTNREWSNSDLIRDGVPVFSELRFHFRRYSGLGKFPVSTVITIEADRII